MVAVARRLARGPISNPEALRVAYKELLEHPDYQQAVETGTGQEGSVATRLEVASRILEAVQ
jgi:hypothetical protein